ncbi:hypothetical protein TNIN_57201, partial [Trichonephila inaurata madagascariensis]
KNL